MKIYLIKSASNLFKYNKCLRFNIFNKNIVFYKTFSQSKATADKTTESLDNDKGNEKELTLTTKKQNHEEIDFDLDLQKSDFNNLHQNIQLRLYQNDSETQVANENSNSLVEKKQDLPANLNKDGGLTRVENLILLKNQLEIEEKVIKEEKYQKSKIGVSLFILLVGLFSLWIPLYKTICESQGFSVKTSHQDYKFQDRKLNVTKKFTVKFIDEVDVELPWEFKALQDKVVINAGETCLIFYRARNKTDKPIVGLSVYDVHPQSLAFYFNKIQCFCFENQMLGPYEEVDLPVFFYIDPSINDDGRLEDLKEFVLKYTFYYAKRQDLAQVMIEHLKREKEDQEKLKERKIELNKQGKKYAIEDGNNRSSGLPGINPLLADYKVEELQQYLNTLEENTIKGYEGERRREKEENENQNQNDYVNEVESGKAEEEAVEAKSQ